MAFIELINSIQNVNLLLLNNLFSLQLHFFGRLFAYINQLLISIGAFLCKEHYFPGYLYLSIGRESCVGRYVASLHSILIISDSILLVYFFGSFLNVFSVCF